MVREGLVISRKKNLLDSLEEIMNFLMGFLLLLTLFIITCVYVCILCTHRGTVHVRMPEGSLQESVLSFHHISLEGHQLTSSGLAAGAFNHLAISSASLWVLLRLHSINSFKFKINYKSITVTTCYVVFM